VAEARQLKSRKKRVRRAPTLREQAKMVHIESEKEGKQSRIRRGFSKVGQFLSKTRITHNPITKFLARIGRFIIKILKWLVPKYFVNAWREVRLVTWPSRRETWRLTMAVFIFAVVFGAMVAGVDKVLDIIFKKVVLK